MKSGEAKLESFSGSESESDPELLSLSDPGTLDGQEYNGFTRPDYKILFKYQ